MRVPNLETMIQDEEDKHDPRLYYTYNGEAIEVDNEGHILVVGRIDISGVKFNSIMDGVKIKHGSS